SGALHRAFAGRPLIFGHGGGQRIARPYLSDADGGARHSMRAEHSSHCVCHTNVTLILLPIRQAILTFAADHGCRR
ncbi:MAG: hypothetical protein DMF26_13195, partial [Verrucomicrobia bacterium]